MITLIRNFFGHIDAFVKGGLSSKTAWFYSSDGNPLLNCGPNATAMLLSYYSRTKFRGDAVRKVNPLPYRWTFDTIFKTIKQLGYQPKQISTKHLAQKTMGVFHVRGNHWVFAILHRDTVEVYDPLTSSYVQKRREFVSTITYPYYISIG